MTGGPGRWSRRHGKRERYADPDLIYPGQVFVLPAEDAIDAVQDGKRG